MNKQNVTLDKELIKEYGLLLDLETVRKHSPSLDIVSDEEILEMIDNAISQEINTMMKERITTVTYEEIPANHRVVNYHSMLKLVPGRRIRDRLEKVELAIVSILEGIITLNDGTFIGDWKYDQDRYYLLD